MSNVNIAQVFCILVDKQRYFKDIPVINFNHKIGRNKFG